MKISFMCTRSKLWIKSWLRILPLNWPYIKARLQGYKYYIEVGIDTNPARLDPSRIVSSNQTYEVEKDLKSVGADVRMVRWVARRNYRSVRWRLFAVFHDENSALLFKLQEGDVGRLHKFKGLFPPKR